MNESNPRGVSRFQGVDQALMFERIAESPLDDAEVGFLSDRDSHGTLERSPSLLAGIEIFAGREVGTRACADDGPRPAQDAEAPRHDPPVRASDGRADSRASFILFGPGGAAASSA